MNITICLYTARLLRYMQKFLNIYKRTNSGIFFLMAGKNKNTALF